jgi:CRP/FNR family cyclic AMP-dependent transcriptional regulator
MKWPVTFLNGASDEPRLRELRGMRLFKQLTPRELREADELLHERAYEKDEIIFDEGDAGLGLFIVVSGRVKVFSSHQALQQLAPEFCCGDFFGEMSLFDESLRTARVIAIEPARVVALFRTEFFSLLDRNKSIGVKILFELSKAVCQRARSLAIGSAPSEDL